MAEFLLQLGLAHLLAGIAITVAVAVLLRLWPGLNARTRHDLWLAALLLMVLMPLLVVVPDPPVDPVLRDPAPTTAAQPATPPPAALPERSPTARGTAPIEYDQPPSPWLDVALLAAWLIGFAYGSARLLLAWRRSRALYDGSHQAPQAAHASLRRLARQAGLKHTPELRCGRGLEAPMTAGLLRPWIALPESWLGEGQTELLEHALAHELAHVLRRDPFASLLQRIASVVFFYHPGVQYACHRLEEERESACDDWAIRQTGGTRKYAESLVLVAEALVTRVNPVLAVGCLRSKSQLRRRITHMLDRNSNHSTKTRWPVLAATTLTAGLALFATRAAWPEPPRIAFELRAAASVITTGVHPDAREVHPHEGLLYAAWNGDLASLSALLDAGADPDEIHRRRGSPRTALVAASARGHGAIVAELIARGADVDLAARSDATPLIAAIRGDHGGIARALLEAGADADRRVHGDGSALIWAAASGDLALVEELLDRGADADAPVPGDGSPLIAAARNGHQEIANRLIAAGADPSRYVRGDEAPLFHAVVDGDLGLVEVLLDGGADPNIRYPGDGTPLMLALRHGHDEVADALIDAGAELNRATRGDGNALIVAVRTGDAATVERLLALGADPDASVRGDGSALINAAALGREDLVDVLLRSGADVNLAVSGDDTPLINAVRSGDEDLVAMLIDAGADVNQPGDRDSRFGARRTPLNQARDAGIIRLLEAAGAR